MRGTQAAGPLVFLMLSACVTGAKIRVDIDVMKVEVERTRRVGALRCAPAELAKAEAHLDFAEGEYAQGDSTRASHHLRLAKEASEKARALSESCEAESSQKTLVVKIDESDSDGDTVFDTADRCPSAKEDLDGFEDTDGCPETDNDLDNVPDAVDRCPVKPGPASNGGCPLDSEFDRDEDGIADDQDLCVELPEDRDGFKDEDGCPEADNDLDGLVDASDKCPDEPGLLEKMGCPNVDRDDDGFADNKDVCPDEPEDKDGFLDEDGCPDLDNDNDGLPDNQDECPNEFGATANRGCAEKDRDGDSITDRLDACPEVPGVREEKGCPRRYKLVEVKPEKIVIKRQIKFASGSHRIVGKDSFDVLKEVALALSDNPRIRKIRIEGHTDDLGPDDGNLRLSQRRAEAVLAALLKFKVDPGRMQAVGFGESQPLVPNLNAAARAENRRTEFNIVEQ